MICIPNQNLEPEEMVAFMAMMGIPEDLPDDVSIPETVVAKGITRVGNVLEDGSIDYDKVPTATYWHADGDIYEEPEHFFYTLLNAKIVPPYGGNTAFVDMRKML